jgi:uncharacterized Zn finger protein
MRLVNDRVTRTEKRGEEAVANRWWRKERRVEPYYAPSRPRKAEGGIKAQSKRGGFGESWWAKRWIQVLDSFEIGARLSRGRSYARNGQVLSIAIDKGRVTAKVQGSRPKPYDIVIEVKTLSEADWSKVVDALSRQAIFAAKLLAGEMPQDIEPVFAEVGLSLFPAALQDLKTGCSCPDWSNPCKHIAAAYYLLGEEFDRDPFLIFALRGLSREALLERLGTKSGAKAQGEGAAVAMTARAAEPLDVGMEPFWNGLNAANEEPAPIVEIPREAAPLVRRLGGFPFWRGEVPLLDALSATYAAASKRGMDVYVGPVSNADPIEVDQSVGS